MTDNEIFMLVQRHANNASRAMWTKEKLGQHTDESLEADVRARGSAWAFFTLLVEAPAGNAAHMLLRHEDRLTALQQDQQP